MIRLDVGTLITGREETIVKQYSTFWLIVVALITGSGLTGVKILIKWAIGP